jgi:hypothetical protein
MNRPPRADIAPACAVINIHAGASVHHEIDIDFIFMLYDL